MRRSLAEWLLLGVCWCAYLAICLYPLFPRDWINATFFATAAFDPEAPDPTKALDLLAQQQMALASWTTAIVAVLSLAVGSVTLFLLWATLRATREVGRDQVRAYLAITNARIVCRPVAEVTLTIHNSGQSEARRISVLLNLEGSPFAAPPRTPVNAEAYGNLPALPANRDHDVIVSAIFQSIVPENQGVVPIETLRVRAVGKLTYQDVFGTLRSETVQLGSFVEAGELGNVTQMWISS